MSRLFSALRFAIWCGLALLLIWFAGNNIEAVPLSFYPFEFMVAVPPWLILFVGIFIGLMAAGMATSWTRLKGFVARRQLARDRARLNDEVATLSEEAHSAAAQKARERVNATAITGLTPKEAD